MKKYIKPTTHYVKLRVEESLAGFASGFTQSYKYELEHEPKPFEGLVGFWMKILRK